MYIQQCEARLHSKMGKDTLEHTMWTYIEGPNHLSNGTLESVLDHYKGPKKRNLALWALLSLFIYAVIQCGSYAVAISNINHIFTVIVSALSVLLGF